MTDWLVNCSLLACSSLMLPVGHAWGQLHAWLWTCTTVVASSCVTAHQTHLQGCRESKLQSYRLKAGLSQPGSLHKGCSDVQIQCELRLSRGSWPVFFLHKISWMLLLMSEFCVFAPTTWWTNDDTATIRCIDCNSDELNESATKFPPQWIFAGKVTRCPKLNRCCFYLELLTNAVKMTRISRWAAELLSKKTTHQ